MGKGDKKSRRGKIINNSYGVRRRKRARSFAAAENNVTLQQKEEAVSPPRPARPRATKKSSE